MRQNHLFTRVWQAPAVRQTRHLATPRLWYRQVTASRRRLPDLIIAGAQKAGTTSLFGYLSEHPSLTASLKKEVHYFDQNLARGENWYRMHFPIRSRSVGQTPRGDQLCFESSPYYMFDPRVPQLIRRTVPHVKLIFLLRDPVSRAYSHYQHSAQRGRESLSFEEAIEAEPERLAGEHERMMADPHFQSEPHRHYSYLARGVYVDQLLRWQEHFDRERMLVVQAERMFRAPGDVFNEVLAFLEAPSWTPPRFATHNSGRYRATMSDATRKRLRQYFAGHNERLFDLLGVRYDWR
ncbi:MAG: sulfotransferase [Planctomycetota bacterium]|nr:MAG: sulfotransferase [Planctomycetota bacterium]